jgi:FkbM family methyltransferase
MSEVFQLAKEALTRAAYRALLKREPDDLAAAAMANPPFHPEEEEELRRVLAQFAASEEFRALHGEYVHRPDYPPSTWARVEIADLLLWVDIGDLGVSRHCVSGDFEPIETNFIRGVVKPGMTFVDVGANIGWFSANAAKLIGPEGRLFSFEPRKDTFRALSRTIEDNGFSEQATLINAAVGEEAGEVFIGWSPELGNPGGTWTLPYAELEHNFRESGAALQQTPVVVIDDVIGDARVDVMKIDKEGAEPIAIRGARGLLRRQRPIILCELNPVLLEKVSRTSPQDFISSVEGEGYVCHVLGINGIAEKLDAARVKLTDDAVNVVFVPAG